MFETLKLILAEILHKQPEEIRMEMDLREDLAATDIDIMRMLIDAAFEFEILDEELSIDGFRTVKDILDYVEENEGNIMEIEEV